MYQEYIRDRHHTHLSATRWKSVAGFLRFLGQKGIAQVKQKKPQQSAAEEYFFIIPKDEGADSDSESDSGDEDIEMQNDSKFERDPSKRPKWFIKLIDKSPEAIMAAKSKSLQQRQAEEEQNLQAKQLEAVQKQAQSAMSTKAAAPIVLVQKKSSQSVPDSTAKVASLFADDDAEDESEKVSAPVQFKQKHLSVLDELRNEDVKIKRAFIPYETAPIVIEADAGEAEDIPWIRKGLLIRIKNDTVAEGKYLGLLAVIEAVIDDFGAQVSVLSSGDQLLLDQDDCEAVSEVSDAEFDAQLQSLDAKIMSTALKTDRCVILAANHVGRDGRVLGKRSETGKFQVEVTEAGSSHIHRLKLDLLPGEFCIFFE